jgi:hypothetical protein
MVHGSIEKSDDGQLDARTGKSQTNVAQAVAFRLTCKSLSFIPREVKDSSLNLALCIIMKAWDGLNGIMDIPDVFKVDSYYCSSLLLVIEIIVSMRQNALVLSRI